MWNSNLSWDNNLSAEMNINKELVDSFKKYAKISGSIFIVLGMIGIIFPTFMTISTEIFVSYLMLFAGILAGWMTWTSNRRDWAGWLKSFALIIVSSIMLFYPMEGIATLGLLLAIYFFMDAFSGFGLAFSLKPQKIWWMWLINAVTSLAIGVIFLIDWPFSSLFMIGLLVGISLLFDGIALLFGGVFIDEVEKEEKNTAPKA